MNVPLLSKGTSKEVGAFLKNFAAFSENLNFNTAVPKQRDTTATATDISILLSYTL